MSQTIDYFFSPSSPWTYLGSARFIALAQRHGAAIAFKPCDFNKVFAASGGLPLGQRPKQRQAYRLIELGRWRDHLGIALNVQPKHFPTSPDLAARVIVATRQAGKDPGKLATAIGQALWAEERDIADPATIAAIADENGLDGAALVTAADGARVRQEYEGNTEEAIARQVFGAPTYICKEVPYWGQDRLDFLERALAAG